MKYFSGLLLLLFFNTAVSQNKKLEFYNTDWGRQVSLDEFCKQTKASGYDGIEIWFPKDEAQQLKLKAALEKYNLKVGFLHGTNKSVPFAESLEAYTNRFNALKAWKPTYINCHTGSDFFTFEENKAFIDVGNAFAKASKIPVYHETHRGRFSFNLPDTERYLNEIPNLKLTLDISHWMVVHESLLQNRNLDLIINKTHHIHARVGHAEGPQVNDPAAPEWDKALQRHLEIWATVIRKHWATSNVPFTITSEFGPPGYMPTLPYSNLPVADQWKANEYIMKAIKAHMKVE